MKIGVGRGHSSHLDARPQDIVFENGRLSVPGGEEQGMLTYTVVYSDTSGFGIEGDRLICPDQPGTYHITVHVENGRRHSFAKSIEVTI